MAQGSNYAWILPYNKITTDRDVAEEWDRTLTGVERVHVDEIVDLMENEEGVSEYAEDVTFPEDQ